MYLLETEYGASQILVGIIPCCKPFSIKITQKVYLFKFYHNVISAGYVYFLMSLSIYSGLKSQHCNIEW